MADPRRRRPENVPGPFFVDSTCIDCDTCRWMAPETYDRRGGMSRVHAQPSSPDAVAAAARAQVACPTSSIGGGAKEAVRAASRAFPVAVDGPVLHCGYHSEKSYGAASYLLLRAAGNVMVDAPRFAGPLADSIDRLGGVRTLFLTHRDDVSDHARWHERFGCERVLHRRDVTRDTRDVERPIDGDAPVALAPDLLVIPTPGHTEGSASLLFGDRYVFTGDHLAKDPRRDALHAFRSVCWFDWDVLTASIERLAAHRFEWVLPGHGRRFHASADAMRAAVLDAAAWARVQ